MFKPHSDKVVIAKVDATMNDVPDEIQGFPTIKLFKAGSKGSPVDYSGSRTIEDLIDFIRDNGSHGIDLSSEAAATEAVETDGMPHQAAAATASVSSAASTASGAAEKVVSAVKGAAEAAAKVVASDDDDIADSHDEL
jgi:protein disulfide-isomerase A1